MYGAAVLGDYIYLIGGHRPGEGYTLSVEKARILPGGSLSKWEETTPLTSPRSYIENATMPLNDIVYIVGGMDGVRNVKCNTIIWGRPRADGVIEKWNISPPFPGQGVDCAVAAATPGYIHVIGGAVKGDVPVSECWSARIAADGSLKVWEQGPRLPFPLWYHSGGVAGGYVWIWGGLSQSKSTSVNRTILYAPILSSGRLGQWQVAKTPLPHGFYSASSTISGQYLISFCPRYSGAQLSNDIWYAYVGSKGVSEWVRVPTRIPSKLYIGLATDYRQGHVYIPGGRRSKTRTDVDNNVYYFKLAASQEEQVSTAGSEQVSATTPSPQQPATQRLSYMQETGATAGSFAGFLSYNEARRVCLTEKKPLILYFHASGNVRCQKQAEIIQQLNTEQFRDKVVFSDIDARLFPQISQQHGVFRVPCWIFYNKQGRKITWKIGIVDQENLEGYAAHIDKQ
jgi:thiol-disulfide isomerase/thioredoxin